MQEADLVIQIREGMHTRPASIFVREAAKFKSEVWLTAGDTRVNGKSIMGILMLALTPGSAVKLEVDGPDEETALNALKAILGSEAA